MPSSRRTGRRISGQAHMGDVNSNWPIPQPFLVSCPEQRNPNGKNLFIEYNCCSWLSSHQNIFLRCFGTTFLTSRLIQLPMAPIHSGMGDASGCLLTCAGIFALFVSGVDGAWSSQTSQLWNISSHQTMPPHENEETFSTLKGVQQSSVPCAGGHVHVLEWHDL